MELTELTELTELIDVEFGKKVRNKRKAIHLSQENLAYRAKIDRTHMGHIERGNVSPSLKKMNQIALALGITLNDLLEDTHLTNPA
jgi:transcriptional regulator with XRE-family HTH domain